MDKDPFTDREILKEVLGWPAWLVDYVIGPLPDEVGWPVVIARLAIVACGIVFVLQLVASGIEANPWIWIGTGAGGIAVALCGFRK